MSIDTNLNDAEHTPTPNQSCPEAKSRARTGAGSNSQQHLSDAGALVPIISNRDAGEFLLLQRPDPARIRQRNDCTPTMKTNYLLSAAVLCMVVGTATPSEADDFCSTLTTVANETKNAFRKFRNGDDGTGGYRSTLSLPGANECYIDKDNDSYECEWQLKFSDDAEAQARTFIDGIKTCFPAAKVSGGKASGGSGIYNFIRLNGVEIYVKGDNKKQRVLLSIDEDD